jgi:surface polysaccharide O-acyltransferase-like enzyme
MAVRLTAFEYIRGVAMLGVVGIHTGAYSLSNPEVNVHLFAWLEILSRFSVPIFFFVSAFGLFYRHRPEVPLDYPAFYRRRAKTVLVPYLAWSLIYMAHTSWLSGQDWIWSEPHIYEYFFFGFASYQLYFLVILIWFYLLMPLWRSLLPALTARPLAGLAALLVLQIAFNYYSSYSMTVVTDNYYLSRAFEHRMSFWVLHYLFVFLLGAVCALRFNDFTALVARHRRAINAFFALTAAGMLAAYYWLLEAQDYSPELAVNTVHQLSPIGVLYTLAACLFFFALFHRPLPPAAERLLALLGRHSYAVYLVHPLVMYYLADWLAVQGLTMTVPVVLLFYSLTIAASLLLSAGIAKVPAIALLLTGCSPPAKVKPGT